ncbi:MAG: ComF family protein [Novosphingobium sp.]|nr:ComF family protein [Novosphingobium sp.]
MPVSAVLRPVTDLLFPPRCPLCGAATADQNGLCAPCWSELAIPGEPSCRTCSRPFGDTVADGLICAKCLSDPPRHDGIAAASLYNEASRRLVLHFKHGNRIALARLMARLINTRLGEVEPGALLVPVPLHRWRLWKRGYNQSALLAGELARLTGAAVGVDVLMRTKRTPTLGGMGARARRKTLKGAIVVNPRRATQCQDRSMILIDDVLTSGATSDACVEALRRAGARSVKIACFARVLDEAIATTR